MCRTKEAKKLVKMLRGLNENEKLCIINFMNTIKKDKQLN